MLAIRLPENLEKRLEELAKRTGRTKTYYVREAIVEHIDDLEDIYLAEARLQALRSGEDRSRPLADVARNFGLHDHVADASAPYLRVGDCTVTCRREGDSVHVVVSPSRRRTIAS
jgi:RHH-type rel operon transcriptional repressor/antitoxin RelB